MAQDMRDVVLTEEDDVAAADPSPRPRTRDGVRPRVRRGAVLAGILAVMLTGIVVEARDRQEAAALATVPGVLRPVGPTMGELWRGPGGTFTTMTVRHDLVVSTLGEPGDIVLTATEAATGGERWTAPLPEVRTRADLWCETVGDAATGTSTHVVCRVVTAVLPVRDRRRTVGPIDRSFLLVLDARTGERLAERRLDSRNSSLAPLGAEVLLLEVLDDGHGRVSAVDPASGRVRWTYRTPEGLPGSGTRLGADIPTLAVEHDTVVVDGPVAWALTPDGEVLGEWQVLEPRAIWDLQQRVELTVLPGGDLVVSRASPGRRNQRSTDALVIRGTERERSLPGTALQPVTDDGSAQDLVLTSPREGGGIVAVARSTGAERWRVEATPGGDCLVLDGRLITTTGTDVMAVDVDTGEVLWIVDDVVPWYERLLTDGHVVLVPTSDPDRGAVLRALATADGRELWAVAAPEDVEEYHTVQGHLLALRQREVIAFG